MLVALFCRVRVTRELLRAQFKSRALLRLLLLHLLWLTEARLLRFPSLLPGVL